MLRPRDLLLLVLFAIAMLAPGIATLPPVDRDESRYAVATTQMLESGDFVDIRYQEQPRYLQPAGIYWLQAASVAALTGPEAREIWAFRIPSVLSAIGAVLLTAWIGSLLFGRTAGLAAGVMLGACISLGFEARIAKIDATLLLAITAAQAALLQLYLDRAARSRLIAAAFWAALGVGLMLKGPIILIVVGATIGALCAWDRNVRWLGRLHAGWGVLLMLAIVLPWYVAIGIHSQGLFYELAVGKSLLGKVANSQQGHKGPPGYHTALFPLMFFPGSLFALLAIPFAWRNRTAPAMRFLIAWIVPSWIVYELVATKLPHYVLPTYPAIACIAAALFFSDFGVRAAARGWRERALAGLAVAAWGLAGGVAVVLTPAAAHYLEGEIPPGVLIVSGLLVVAIAATLLFLTQGRPTRALGAAAAAGFLFAANGYVVGLPQIEPLWTSPRIVAEAERVRPCPDSRLITTPYHEPSLVFLYGPENVFLARSPESAAEALTADQACGLAVVGAKEQERFLAEARSRGVAPRQIGLVSGRNYSDQNADLDLRLYAAR